MKKQLLLKFRKGLNFDINGLTKTLVFGRILNPASKIANGDVEEKHIYKTLTFLDDLAIAIQKKIFNESKKIDKRKTLIISSNNYDKIKIIHIFNYIKN